MPYLFIIAGVVMVIAAVRNTVADYNGNPGLLTLVKGDFSGKGNFVYWLVSILIIGAVGYIPDLKPISRAFLVLVVIVLFLDNKGVFANAVKAINGTQANNNAVNATNTIGNQIVNASGTNTSASTTNPLASAAGVAGPFATTL